MLLTFSVTNQFPVCCLFINQSNALAFDTVDHMTSTDPNMIESMLVFNPSTNTLETLGSNSLYVVFIGGQGSYYAFVNSNAPNIPTGLPAARFLVSNNQLLYLTPDEQYSTLAYLNVNSYLVFCNDAASCPQTADVQLVNSVTLNQIASTINTLQNPQTLCCTQDILTIIGFIMSLTIPVSQVKANLFSSLEACQLTDQNCACPTLNTCWMYNNSNVLCCIQGNPTNPVFANDKPAFITKDENACIAAAVNCSNWRFNTVDVPCCIQRSTSQWNTAGYSLTGLQSFNTKAECDAAAQCSFNTLLKPPPNVNNYYNLILESQFTSGCEPLRTNGVWGNSTTCDSDPNPTACLAGNCSQNYCSPWTSASPYLFTQNVKCLASPECCPVGKSPVITNPGQPNVTWSCQ